MAQQRKITGENIHIVRDCAEGKISCAEAAERCGVVFETMRRWVSRYCAEGAAALLKLRTPDFSKKFGIPPVIWVSGDTSYSQ